MSDHSENKLACSQLRKEIMSMVIRYGAESDMTVYQALGVLRVTEADLIDMLDNTTGQNSK